MLATNSAAVSPLLQASDPARMDLLLTPGEHVFRSDVAERAIQADFVVILGVALDKTPRIAQRQWLSNPDASPLRRFVPTLDFSVLGIIAQSSDLGVMPKIRMNS